MVWVNRRAGKEEPKGKGGEGRGGEPTERAEQPEATSFGVAFFARHI